MTDVYPHSASEAESHIRQIRYEKGLGDDPSDIARNAVDLEAALHVLSVDLYQTSTHFLLELIQNADDNKYDSKVEPTLRISYSPGRLRIDCNELGFSRRNVEAICRICQSTKSGRHKASGFVGEKGIGFKAVFKVASTVHVTSGHYAFRFDREGHLGMIAPIWSPFPGSVEPGWTSILLELDDECDEAAIVEQLRLTDTRRLMFLRRLRRLDISVSEKQIGRQQPGGKKGKKTTGLLKHSAGFRNILVKDVPPPSWSSDPDTIMTLHENGQLKRYLVWRQPVSDLPREARRPGITESEIVMAFPLQRDGTPHIASQSVYAHLPIRDYGFKFLVQADFLLPTNREDIHADSHWNQALVEAASDAFVEAALHMSGLPEGNPLRYSWISFVPQSRPHSEPMATLFRDIIRKLGKAHVLYTLEPSVGRRSPVTLNIVPRLYRDRDGVPFVQSRDDASQYVSGSYDSLLGDNNNPKTSALADMGVTIWDHEKFLVALAIPLIRDVDGFLCDKTPEWHTSLSVALYTIVLSEKGKDLSKTPPAAGDAKAGASTVSSLTKRIHGLPIIPVRRGGWQRSVHGGGRTLYFPQSSSTTVPIPEGILTDVVTDEAAADPDRRRLLEFMGVNAMKDDGVPRLIVRDHDSYSFRPDSLTPRVLASHLESLFLSGWDPEGEDACDPWLAAEQGPCRRASMMYLPSPCLGAAYNVLPHPTPVSTSTQSNGNTIPVPPFYGFLHPEYMSGPVAKEQPEKWLRWLENKIGLPVYPRIWHPGTLSSPNPTTHHDFKSLLLHTSPKPSSLWLVVLREGWERYYKEYLDPVATRRYDVKRFSNLISDLIDTMRDTPVPCTGSAATSAPLREAYFPTDELKKAQGGRKGLVPFLDIPDPDDPAWNPVLPILRIYWEPCLPFYLDCLKGYKRLSNVSFEEVSSLMRKVQGEAGGAVEALRSSFHRKALICIPPKQKNGRITWTTRDECVWSGEPWLTQTHVLRDHYPDLSLLFQHYLRVPDACTRHYVFEALAVPRTTADTRSTKRIEQVLVALSAQIVNDVRAAASGSGDDGDGDDEQSGLPGIPAVSAKTDYIEPHLKDALLEAKMFPIVSTSERNDRYDRLASVEEKQSWLIADRAVFRTQFRGGLPLLALSAEVVLRIRPLLEALGLRDRFLSRVATNITEAHGDVVLLDKITAEYRARSHFLFRLIPPGLPNQTRLRSKFRQVDVFSATTIKQYWRAPLELRQIQSAETTGVAFVEADYYGDLRIYMLTGYDGESHPYELAEQLRELFGIAAEHRDLVLLALTGRMERVEGIFASRGVAPLFEDESVEDDIHGLLGVREASRRPDSATSLRANGTPSTKETVNGTTPHPEEPANTTPPTSSSRFSRLLNKKRFHPSFFKQENGTAPDVLPSYTAALSSTTPETPTLPSSDPGRQPLSLFTLASLRSTVKKEEREFKQKEGVVIGAAAQPASFIDRIMNIGQRDIDMGEAIAAEALSTILGPQYNPNKTRTPRDQRNRGRSAFVFPDSQGRFASFLMRLEGRTGKAQGFSRLTYHLDVKVTDKMHAGVFELSQVELNKAREFSSHTTSRDSEQDEKSEPDKNVAVLVHISDVRSEPKLVFLVDPWDLYLNGELVLETPAAFRASLRLRPRAVGGLGGGGRGGASASAAAGAGAGVVAAAQEEDDAGFDTVQFGTHERRPVDGGGGDAPPGYQEMAEVGDVNWPAEKGKERMME